MSIEAEVQELRKELAILKDKAAIQSLQNRYCSTVDAHEWTKWSELWTEDGVFDFPPIGTFQGRKDIAEAVKQAEQGFAGMAHSIMNLEVDLISENSARGVATLIFYASPDMANPRVHSACGGLYNFQYTRTSEGWRISRMNLNILWESGASEQKPF